MRTEQHKNLPIPVVDFHGDQMIYQGLGVLRETGDIDTENKKKSVVSNHLKVEETAVFCSPCYREIENQSYPEASILPIVFPI